ncbi:MAG TPA: GAF domain-containing protein [Candidatus Limnocylindria bacterium]|nr:GAF domain-containing protein [Candidatus Limnocylindria bacterium]
MSLPSAPQPGARLADVRAGAGRTAAAIKSLLGVDVVIVDTDLSRVADTFGYAGREIVVRSSSIVGMIIQTGKSLAIDDKERFESCRRCQDRAECRMQSLIGVPILLSGRVAGAIALVIPRQTGAALFERLASTLDFLGEVAHGLSAQIKAVEDTTRLLREKHERELLIDCVEDAAAILDERGLITFSNRAFDQRFFSGSRTVNIPLENVIPDPGLARCLREGRDADGLAVSCGDGAGCARCTLRFLDGGGAALILRFGERGDAPSQGKTAHELVAGEVRRLLAAGRSKTDIACTLGISRATLYRMLKNERTTTG